MALAKASPSPNILVGCRSTRHMRRRLRTSSDRKRTTTTRTSCCKVFVPERKDTTAFRSSRSQRDHFFGVVTLSITVLLLACSTVKEAPMLATAFVQNSYSRPSTQWNTSTQKHHHIQQLPTLPHRILPSTLSAKKDDTENDSEKDSSPFGFFQRDGSNEDNSKDEEEDDSKNIPIVGRFFATEEEKEEKKRIKREEKEEKAKLKAQMKRAAKRERIRRERRERNNDSDNDSDNDEETRSKLVAGVKNYFRERQIRKDEEILRFQVKRAEEKKQRQIEKDAEELRLAVQQREEERRIRFALLEEERQKKLAARRQRDAKISSEEEDIVRKKIQTQKELDRKRKEREDEIRAAEEEAAKQQQKQKAQSENAKDEKSSKSQRLGGVVSAAQKFVSGVFDGKPEEWIVVAPKTRISPGEIVPVTAAGIDLLLVAAKDGSAVHCMANSCPHLGTPLELGSLERLPIESGPQNPASSSVVPKNNKESSFFNENDIANMLKQDGCEDCIVCPLHKTAFALKSGEVRGEWCPYPPVIGKLTGAIKTEANLPVFDVRVKGKNIEVRLNTPVEINDGSSKKKR